MNSLVNASDFKEWWMVAMMDRRMSVGNWSWRVLRRRRASSVALRVTNSVVQ